MCLILGRSKTNPSIAMHLWKIAQGYIDGAFIMWFLGCVYLLVQHLAQYTMITPRVITTGSPTQSSCWFGFVHGHPYLEIAIYILYEVSNFYEETRSKFRYWNGNPPHQVLIFLWGGSFLAYFCFPYSSSQRRRPNVRINHGRACDAAFQLSNSTKRKTPLKTPTFKEQEKEEPRSCHVVVVLIYKTVPISLSK